MAARESKKAVVGRAGFEPATNNVETVPNVPASQPSVVLLIGSVRGDLLDRACSWNALDHERKLQEFCDYYNSSHVHQSLDASTPAEQAGQSRHSCAALDSFGWQEHCRGLFQTPVAV